MVGGCGDINATALEHCWCGQGEKGGVGGQVLGLQVIRNSFLSHGVP